MHAAAIGAWRYAVPLCGGLLAGPLVEVEAQSPHPMQEGLPRASLAGKMRFSTDPANKTNGYCAGFSMHDHSRNAVQIGVQSDWHDVPSSGIPKVHSNMHYASADLGRGAGFQYEYGDYRFNQNTWYQVELRYFDDQKIAQFLVDGQVVYTVPAILVGRIFFSVLVCGRNNGDVVKADFENVTIGGFIPNGNGKSNDVVPYFQWNTRNYNFWGLSIQQTNHVNMWQGANFHAEGTITGMPPGLDWDTVEPATGKAPQATALNAEFWFNQ